MLQKIALAALTFATLNFGAIPSTIAADAPTTSPTQPVLHRGSGRLDAAQEVVECPVGTVYRGGSAEPCQAQG